MNGSLIILEIAVLALGLALLLLDLWTPPERKRLLGYGAAAALIMILGYSFSSSIQRPFSMRSAAVTSWMAWPFFSNGFF